MSGKKKALVTGACGFVGSHIIDLLVEDNDYEDVIATDLEAADTSHLEDKDVEFRPADFTKPDTIDEILDEDIDVIYNPAAAFNYEMPMPVMKKINVEGGRNFAEAVVENVEDLDIFVHVSTGEIYGYNMFGKSEDLDEDGHFREVESKTPGEAPYAKTKKLQEEEIWELHEEEDLPVVDMRLGTVYGPGLFFARLVNLFIDLASLGRFPDNINFRWPLVHVEDVASAAKFLSEEGNDVIGEAYNIVDEQEYILSDMVYKVADYMDMEVENLPNVPSMGELWKLIPKGKLVEDILDEAYPEYQNEVEDRYDDDVWMKYNHAGPYAKLLLNTMPEWDDDFTYSNKSLKELGWEPKYESFLDAIPEIIEWSKENGYLVENPGLKHLITKALISDPSEA